MITERHLQMTGFFRFCLLPMAALAFSFASIPVQAQAGRHLEMTVKLARHTVSMQQDLSLLVVLHNPGPQRIVLRGDPGFSDVGGLVVTAIDAAGRRHALTPEPGFISQEDVRSGNFKTVLAPDEGLGLGHQFSAAELFPQPGTYSIIVEYQSPMPSASNASVVPGEREGSRAVSTALAIEVRE